MKPTTTWKVTIVLAQHHNWLKGLRGISLVVEHLLDKEFGSEIGSDKDADRIAAEKIVQAQKIIEKMREEKQKINNDPD